jgi:membrane protein DedA with SNARE-associated domain
MAQHILDLLRSYLVHYGYWAVAGALLLENAGLPVPGETVLLLASFLAFSEHTLRLPYIILIGTCAATLGDNLGYALGHYGGRPLLERYQNIFRVSAPVLERGERLFQRYGSVTILFARFVFGMRVIAGPLAGVLRMPWRQFLIFNLMGAALWVTVISTVGYLFGRHWDLLLHYIKRADIALTILAVLVVLWLWWGKRKVNSRPV